MATTMLRWCAQGDGGAVVEEGQAIAAAQQLVNEAQTLSVKVDREVEKLREVCLTSADYCTKHLAVNTFWNSTAHLEHPG